MKSVKAIGHVAIRVKEIGRSLDFYANKLGFAEMFRLYRDNGDLWIVYLRVTETQFIELFPDGTGARAPASEAIGYNHLCLEVDDMDRAIAEVTKAGVALSRPKKMGADFNLQAWVEDPDGNRIEFMQLGKDAMQTVAINKMRVIA